MRNCKTKYQDEIITKIKNLRMDNGISQNQLSSLLSISPGQVGNIESPKYQHKFTLKQIQLFCDHLNYPIEKIFLSEDECCEDDVTGLIIKRIIDYYERADYSR